MHIWQAIVLGLIQGLTEFLPVSSSGHLVFFGAVLGVEEGDLFFDVMLHLGTLAAVFAVFRREILDLFRKPYQTLLYLVVATIPAAIAGLWLEDLVGSVFRGGLSLSVCFLVTAGLLFCSERVFQKRKRMLPLSWKTTAAMGLMQAIAILPGISRSGSTIAAGILAGGEKKEVAKFSFLMSIPVILGSVAVEWKHLVFDGAFEESVAAYESTGAFVGAVVVGVVVSAISGLFAIKVMLKIVDNGEYQWFSLYLVLLAIACFILTAYNIL